jgi:hypothetical protein
MNREPGEPSSTPDERPHPRSPLAHPSRSPSPTALCSTNRLTLRAVHFGPPASAAKMGSHDDVVSRLHRTQREVGSQCNSEPGSPASPPRVSSSLSPTSCRLLSTAVVRSRISFFEPYVSFSPFSAALHHIDLAAYLGSHHCGRSAPPQFQEWIEDDDVGGGKSWVARIIHSCTIRYSLSNSSLNDGDP